MQRIAQWVLLPFALLVMTGCARDVERSAHDVEQYVEAGAANGTQWAGPVMPTDPNCGKQTTGLMTLGAKKFSFDPFGSVTVIGGNVDHDRLEGSATIAAPGQKGAAFQFAGTISRSGNGSRVIQGAVTSAPCTWRVSLRRQ